MWDNNLGYSLRLYTPITGSLHTIISSVQNDTSPVNFEGNEQKVVRMCMCPLLDKLLSVNFQHLQKSWGDQSSTIHLKKNWMHNVLLTKSTMMSKSFHLSVVYAILISLPFAQESCPDLLPITSCL